MRWFASLHDGALVASGGRCSSNRIYDIDGQRPSHSVIHVLEDTMERTYTLLGPFARGEKLELLQGLVDKQEFVTIEFDSSDDSGSRHSQIGWYRILDAITSWDTDGQMMQKAGEGDICVPCDVLVAARIFCLSRDELYFLETPNELKQAINHRNEAAALSLIQQKLKESRVPSRKTDLFLKGLETYCSSLWSQFRDSTSFPLEHGKEEHGEALDSFLSWANDQGIYSKLTVGNFRPHNIRGCMATKTINVGDDVLSIPQETLIYDETVLKTDVGKMLSVIPGLSMDNVLVLFTMIDRWDDGSVWKPFWKQLPDAFKTGISFDPSVVDLLQGSAAYDEIRKAQNHIKGQYDACSHLFDILISAYPAYLTRDMFTYDRYVWAVELWYSYAFEIEFPPNLKSKTVMVPFACLVNHSPWPHVVRYGKMDMDSKMLRYPAFRPCEKGEQIFISYGPVPNMKLIAYYGFAIEGNPHDIVPITLEIPGQSTRVKEALDSVSLGLDHNLRYGPIPRKLKACLRILVADSCELEDIIQGKSNPLQGEINENNEEQASKTLYEALEGVHKALYLALQRYDDQKVPENWKLCASFCKMYLQNQCSIMEKSLEACL